MSHIVIIGNGVAGVTLARQLRKRSDHRITIISSESDHFYSRPALMYIYMGHMEYAHTKPYEDWFWSKNRIELVRDHVQHVDVVAKCLHMTSGSRCDYDTLVFATGAQTNMIGWAGQDLQGVQGFTSLADLDLLEQNSRNVRNAVIVGCGLIGVEVAEMLRSRDIGVTMLARESGYWNNVLPAEESAMVRDHLAEHGVHVRLSTELERIVGRDNRVQGVELRTGETLSCELVVLTTGVRPRTDLAQASGIPTQRGILVDDYFATSVPHVYAIGDCAERPNGCVDLLWYTARAHGETLAATLCGERTAYKADVFYNSAKFFDIEYQTYGRVPAATDTAHNINSYTLWVRGRRGFLRITHTDNRVVGFNAMGIRLRAQTCMQWIRDGVSLEHALKHLAQIQFDEEFTPRLRHATPAHPAERQRVA